MGIRTMACPFCSKIINASDFIALHKPLAIVAIIKNIAERKKVIYAIILGIQS